MAPKSIMLSGTNLVQKHVITVAIGPVDDLYRNYYLDTEIISWLEKENIKYKFNTRKGRLKFYNEDDASLFTLTWL